LEMLEKGICAYLLLQTCRILKRPSEGFGGNTFKMLEKGKGDKIL